MLTAVRCCTSFQIVGELSETLSMEKEHVEKTAKEYRSDELSAMYNMKMDEWKKQQGFCTIHYLR